MRTSGAGAAQDASSEELVRDIKERASRFLNHRQPNRAAACFARLVQLEPAEERHWLRLGDCRRWMGLSGQAIECYREALELFRRRGEFGKALAISRVILDIDNCHSEAWLLHHELLNRQRIRDRRGTTEADAPAPPTPADGEVLRTPPSRAIPYALQPGEFLSDEWEEDVPLEVPLEDQTRRTPAGLAIQRMLEGSDAVSGHSLRPSESDVGASRGGWEP